VKVETSSPLSPPIPTVEIVPPTETKLAEATMPLSLANEMPIPGPVSLPASDQGFESILKDPE